jgi:hypothetical protein
MLVLRVNTSMRIGVIADTLAQLYRVIATG